MPDLQDALNVLEDANALPRPRKRRRRRLAIDREEVVRVILEEKGRAEEGRSAWKDNHSRWLAKYLGQIEPAEEGMNIHIPVLMTQVQRLTAGLVGAIFAGGQVLKARARNPARAEEEDTVTDFLNFQLLEELNLAEVVEQLGLDFFVHGKFIAKVPWVVKKEGVREVHRFDPDVDFVDVLMQLYPGASYEEKGPYSYLVGGSDRVEFYPTDTDTEVVVTRDITTWENPKIVRRRLEDIFVPNPDTLKDLLQARWIIDRYWLTPAEIRRLAEDKVYDYLRDEDLQTIREWEEGGENKSGAPEGGVKDVTAGQQGVEVQEDETGTRKGLAVLECYWWWDLDGDGYPERAIFTVIEKFKLLARAKYLSEVYRDNEWPYAEAGFFPTEGFYHMGVPEFAEGLQDAITILHNQGLEWGAITNAPVGFYRPSSALKPETIRYRAGDLIPLDTPRDDIVFPQFPSASQTWRFNEESLLNQYLQQGLAQGPVQFGQPPEGRASVLRTARATMALIAQGDLLADLTLKRFYRGLTRIFKLVWRRDKEFLPPGRPFRVVGVTEPTHNPFRSLKDRQSLAGDYDFELLGNNVTANRDVMRQAMLMVFQALVNPLLVQAGILQPHNIYEIVKELLVSLERRDFHRFITPPPDINVIPPRDPQDEHSLMMAGTPAKVSPQEDLQAHLRAHLAFVASDEFGAVPPEYVPLFQAHLQDTLQALQTSLQRQQLAVAAGRPPLGPLPGAQAPPSPPSPPTEVPAPGALGPGSLAGLGGYAGSPRSQQRE